MQQTLAMRKLLFLAACLLVPVVQAATTYRPTDDAVVLDRWPAPLLSQRSELDMLHARLDSQPDDVRTAVALAERYLAIGSTTGDPRSFGYARAALQPWWTEPEPPLAVLLVRARLKEKDHQ